MIQENESHPLPATADMHQNKLAAAVRVPPALNIWDEITWRPRYLTASPWLEHVPFAFWVVNALRPNRIVQLGIGQGVSYAAFCQAVEHLDLQTQCCAVLTCTDWACPDDVAGSAHANLAVLNEHHYRHISTLLKMTFDEATSCFADGDIDLLHIKGSSSHQLARDDLRNWQRKLSNRAVVLVHSIGAQGGDSGVWRWWRELSSCYPHFEFLHGEGLGVLGVGRNRPAAIQSLFEAAEASNHLVAVRDIFAARGAATRESLQLQKALMQVTELHTEIETLRKEQGAIQAEVTSVKAASALMEAETLRLRDQAVSDASNACKLLAQQLAEANAQTRSAHKDSTARVAALETTVVELQTKLTAAEAMHAALVASTSWRVTAPIRKLRNAAATGSLRPDRLTGRAATNGQRMLRSLWRVAHRLPTATDPSAAATQTNITPQLSSSGSIHDHPVPTQPTLPSLRVLIVAELSLPQCKKYRVDQRREMIVSLGYDCTVVPWQEVEYAQRLLSTHSLIIFYRVPAFPEPLRLIDEAKRRRLPCYFELDDLIFDINRYLVNPNLDYVDRSVVGELMNGAALYRRSLETCENTIASTPRLAEIMHSVGGGVSFMIENALDAETLRLAANTQSRPVDGRVRIVYGSGTLTHDADFALITEALLRVAARHQCVDIMLIGHLEPAKDLLDLGERVLRKGLVAYDEYLALLAHGDIAIAPLFPIEFNDAKSNIKFIEAAIVGVPAVCSPRSAFAGAVRHGETGFLAETGDEWFAALDTLVADAKLRERIGSSARAYVLANYDPSIIAQSQLRPLLEMHRPDEDSRPHVMLVNTTYRPHSRNYATALTNVLTEALDKTSRARVSIFTTCPDPLLPPYHINWADKDGLTVIQARVPDKSDPSENWSNGEAAELFREVLRAFHPNAVHFHADQSLDAALIGICHDEGVRCVVMLHDAWWLCHRQSLIRADGRYCGQRTIDLNVCATCVSNPGATALRAWHLRQILARADLLVAPSNNWRNFYIDNGFSPDSIVTIETGINSAAPATPSALSARLRFGFAGSANGAGGFALVMRAFEELGRGDWELVISTHDSVPVGKPQPNTDQENQGLVRVVGPYDPDHVDSFFCFIDVLIVPSQWPESSTPIVREALARNKWIIATGQASGAEAIVHGMNGTLISGGDLRPLRLAIMDLLNGTPNLRHWVNPYRDQIHSVEAHADELRVAIDRVLTRPVVAPTERSIR